MTMREMAREYRASAELLRRRRDELRPLLAQLTDERELLRMEERIKMLQAMWSETRDLAVLMERYYERGYRRNGKYTV